MPHSTNTIWSQGLLHNGGVVGRVEENGVPNSEEQIVPLEIKLSTEQEEILKVAKRGGNVFFTGPAGTGKSVLLRAIIQEFLKTEMPDTIAITATTGIAALAIGGQTLHSYGGIGLGSEVAEILYRKVRRCRVTRERWQRTRVWIVDEISMLKAELFDKLEYIARYIRNSRRPFGGIQLILTGDFFQLPPVTKKRRAVPPDYVFGAQTWKACIPHPYFLREVFRQKDRTFIDILSSMRLGSLTKQQINTLKSLERPLPAGTAGVEPASLLSRRKQVAAHNKQQLAFLQGPTEEYLSMDSAGWDVYRQPLAPQAAQKHLESETLAPENLILKVGAQVMLIQNVVQGVLVNGSIGKVVEFMTVREAQKKGLEISAPSNNDEDGADSEDGLDYDEDANFRNPPTQPPPYQHRAYIEERILARYKADPSIAERPTELRDTTGRVFPQNQKYPVVHFANDRRLLCVPMFFECIGLMGNTEARRVQVPLILSWAITIHKSQGQTLDFVKVNFEGISDHGQAYVAVSRATSMDGLQLVNFQPDKIHASQRVLKWHNDWQNQREAEAERQLLAEVATDDSWMDDAFSEEHKDDAELFDSYNTEISEEWLEEHELFAEIAADSSWVEDGLTDTDSDRDDESFYDSYNTAIPEFLIPTQ